MAYLGPSLRREKRAERPARRAGAAVVASIALNAVLLWALALSGAFRLEPAPDSARVALARIDAREWEANRRLSADEPRRRPADEPVSGEVVRLPPEPETGEAPREDERPPNARFLAERNRRVKKETVSRYAGAYPKLAPEPRLEQRDRTGSGEDGRSREAERGAEGRRGDAVALAPGPDGQVRPETGEGGRRAEGKRVPDLSVGPSAAARALAGPDAAGLHAGIEEGEGTYLNTAQFKYAGYINRIGDAIAEDWRPRVQSAVRDRDPDGSTFLYKDRLVVLGITIDMEGRVTDLSVLQSSKVNFLDSVALAAVRATQPFPNPPPGLFGGEQEARIAFGFTVLSAEGGRVRWFRNLGF